MMQLLLLPAGASTLHLLIRSVLLYAGWTMVSVPYLAWGAEWATDTTAAPLNRLARRLWSRRFGRRRSGNGGRR